MKRTSGGSANNLMRISLLVVGMVIASMCASPQGYQLKLGVAYTYEQAGDWDFTFLPEGQLLVWRKAEPKLNIVDWQEGQSRTVVLTVPNEYAPSDVSKRRRVSRVQPVPNTGFLFVTMDGELYRVDRDGWKVVESYGGSFLHVARDGRFVVVVKPVPRDKATTATVVETTKWTTVRSITIPDRGVFLTPDNKYIAVGQFVWRDDAKRCLMSFFEVETGKLVSVTDFLQRSQDCPGYAAFFHPTSPSTLISDRFSKEVVFWDSESGLVLKTISEPYRLQKPAISPDGRLLYGSVRERDPRMLRDFKIWDVESGRVVYESPLYENLVRARSENAPIQGMFSPDSKHLAVRTRRGVRLYRLEEK